ncbi:glycosyltransferase family 2 protein [Variovorax terrae]|uniref:Glycosyltransferase family 2 protein n=1 Tax=Variovorax terrae TaxID=2923278 RepID=A0A9X2AQL6_9BURK|nr:glycosyltransferase family 2 protein [Variovorax terrae]
MPQISAYIIAYNEAAKVADAIRSVSWADEVVVADSHSTDDTARIAESLGARVVQIPFNGFGALRNDAVAACTHEWIFSLDSDERCTPEVGQEIRDLAARAEHGAFFVPRRNFFLGREIRHSGWYPNYRQPQLFRKEAMRYEMSPVHEGFELADGVTVGYLRHAIWQLPFKDLAEVIGKMNRYSTLGATKRRQAGSSYGKAFTHALWAFWKHYLFKRGFLDGWPGFVIALSYFEVTFYRYAKAVELAHEEQWAEQWKNILKR